MDTGQPFPASNVQLYVAYMEEIKQRSEAITASALAIRNGVGGEPAFMRAEFAFLQLRYICELVALNSLAAHHSIGLGARLLKAWNAAEVFSLLEQINPHCFPSSIRNVPDNLGVYNFQVIEGPPSITRSDLGRIYAGCGVVLHRGLIKDAVAGKPRKYNLDHLNRWHRDIMELLKQHMILIRDPDRTLLVNFQGENGRVAVYSAEAIEPDGRT